VTGGSKGWWNGEWGAAERKVGGRALKGRIEGRRSDARESSVEKGRAEE
jgi:hypothetical protein